nr:helix-turn-helix domain-containing protein [Eubacterium sp.]
MEKIIKILTDPVANNLIQLIRVEGRLTISEILKKAEGIPRATVYRKIDKMLEAGIIEVVDTNKVRGQTENIYS